MIPDNPQLSTGYMLVGIGKNVYNTARGTLQLAGALAASPFSSQARSDVVSMGAAIGQGIADTVSGAYNEAGALINNPGQTGSEYVQACDAMDNKEFGTMMGDITFAAMAEVVGAKGLGRLGAAGKAVDGLPGNLSKTLNRIENDGSYPHRNDGSIFRNDQGVLPSKSSGYYKEYVHPTEGINHAGKQRVVTGKGGEAYYSSDHYKSFTNIKTKKKFSSEKNKNMCLFKKEKIKYFKNKNDLDLTTYDYVILISEDISTQEDLMNAYVSNKGFMEDFGKTWDALKDVLTSFFWIPNKSKILILHENKLNLNKEDNNLYLQLLELGIDSSTDKKHEHTFDLDVYFPSK